jgi:hypothetical protein
MKMKYYIVILLSLPFLFIYGCETVDVFENKEITGVVYYRDTLLETVSKIAPRANIYLQESSDSTKFLYSVTSDENGKFSIPYKIKNKENQFIRGAFTLNGINYTGQIPQKNNPESLTLSANYYGYYLKVKLNLKGDPLNNVNVYLFSNQEYLKVAKDTSIADANVKNYTNLTTTNERGVALYPNLNGENASTKYYVLVKYVVSKVKKTKDTTFSVVKNNRLNRMVINLN